MPGRITSPASSLPHICCISGSPTPLHSSKNLKMKSFRDTLIANLRVRGRQGLKCFLCDVVDVALIAKLLLKQSVSRLRAKFVNSDLRLRFDQGRVGTRLCKRADSVAACEVIDDVVTEADSILDRVGQLLARLGLQDRREERIAALVFIVTHRDRVPCRVRPVIVSLDAGS